ncbi:5'/3'-nucleotidase SurE [Neorhizobium sp. BETTINA12A]|jgi:5'-nucleotidase|uniref:5'/3'-nucleotidase SurE n=1 Tax=unclassified Neorhizobium TaxID=2629175 RepID=UPI001FF21DC4|nr:MULTISPECIES: 5'/3'-nucleotidase SurE [unclassified Neorhizobium]MCJ9674003.1 5'/3'-nucleotidase SurE [Neorhizobium sp. SHOUNA12B]MCJ9744478.1 5'/3'-nucleotidase SurE [Neorhizobium sp. SHOUNA12A]MCJ9754133.1 5'/3'-nucleotidase SurE [Neorhizobium sp. BETTINA12A]
MRILLTNDDGIHAEGLAVLERIARKLSDDVWIVAPETDQSGLAHSLTLSEPLRLRKVGDKHFALRGTPTDCVIMGIREILPEKPDLVLSGVNDGANMADDVTYSGTIAGAIEGTLQGVRSFSLSQAVRRENGRFAPWEVAESYAPDLIRKLIDVDLPDGTFLNLNFPNCEPSEVQGVEVTSQGKLDFGLTIDARNDGRGLPYYWLRFGERKGHFREGTDIQALKENKISVTPLKLDLTDHSVQDRVAKALGFGAAD